jgi:uncharacterized protein
MYMKRAIIVHGWGGRPEEGWFLWLKNELEVRGYSVLVPEMPETAHPKIAQWVGRLRELIGVPDEELVLIGHSIGCQTILRYLETIDVQIARSILVAPWVELTNLSDDEEWAIAKPWLETLIDFAAARAHCAVFNLFFSDNDPFVPLSNKDALEQKLGGTSLVYSGKGHLSEEHGVTELPEILDLL